MTDLSQTGTLSPIDRARLSGELLQIRNDLAAGTLSAIDKARASARAIQIRAVLGAAPAVASTNAEQTPPVALTGNEFGEFPDTPEGKKDLRAAAKAYLEGMRGQMVDCPALGEKVEIRQRGIKETIAFSGNPKKLRLLHAIPKIITSAKVASRSDNHKRDKKPDVVAYINLKSTVLLADEEITVEVVIEQDSNGHLYYDLMIDPPKEKAMLDSSNTALGSKRSPDHNSGHLLDSSVEQGHEGVTLDDAGGAQVLNLFLDDDAPGQQEEAPPAPAAGIVEYTTRKGKVLRGVIRTDLTLDQAKAIDPYTWRINGGYFIREKHLAGDTSAVPAAPAPATLTPEQETEKADRDARVVIEQKQKLLASQVTKLRAAGDKAIAAGSAGMNQDRLTNTHRRAGMAATAIARAANEEAEGATLNNIADAMEVGAAGPLAKLDSRAQLQELKRALDLARHHATTGLSYNERRDRMSQPIGEQDLQHVRMPAPLVWSSRYRDAALAMAKKAPTGNSRLIAALTKMGQRAERWRLTDDGDIAITRKAHKVLGTVKEGYYTQEAVDVLGRVDRLTRMDITNDAQLQDACRALLPHLAARKEESAVAKAERAIIGQKVGIDFFPTPAAVAQRMARLAGITKGMRVLEPSAGNGNLADAAAAAGAVVDVVEISSSLRDILTAKGYNVVDHDFTGFKPEKPYDAILMNPPFSNRQDAAHIMQAFGMLAAGGKLVAIAGEGVFFGVDKKAEQFRDWLDSHNADVEKLEGGTFQDNALLAQTSANARLIIIHK
ncbi:methyltransferase domain-containing protein [Pseudomonas viridiflava]|uniref:LPD3 domain-containing protein n=3 Tax=Pseudomonas viridiflava TaxID=33069 RepID=UPI000F05C182|nr:methyltransferase domain-containing protein [Pseudomonas viridiflava]